MNSLEKTSRYFLQVPKETYGSFGRRKQSTVSQTSSSSNVDDGKRTFSSIDFKIDRIKKAVVENKDKSPLIRVQQNILVQPSKELGEPLPAKSCSDAKTKETEKIRSKNAKIKKSPQMSELGQRPKRARIRNSLIQSAEEEQKAKSDDAEEIKEKVSENAEIETAPPSPQMLELAQKPPKRARIKKEAKVLAKKEHNIHKPKRKAALIPTVPTREEDLVIQFKKYKKVMEQLDDSRYADAYEKPNQTRRELAAKFGNLALKCAQCINEVIKDQLKIS